ncbi:MAG TPA: hypothetical protein VMX77_01825 [Candidatus Bathyarchaeia archaeon]|nr:hypothetical protein [Candidatus Bathyarchaeia archaeon]
MPLKIGMCFSRRFEGSDPLVHIGKKLPVYLRLLELCQERGWQVFILTRRTYEGDGIFNGVWYFSSGSFIRWEKSVKIDLVYDRVAGMKFPPEHDSAMVVVNRRDFKFVCYNKWLAYRKLGHLMAKTYWVGERKNLPGVLDQIKTDWVVLKPHNGMKGIGIFIGPKEKALAFEFTKKKIYFQYIAQEFVDTSAGIPGIVRGQHDLRVAVANGEAVWSHVRTPPPGDFRANVAQGGSIKELGCAQLPSSIKKIVSQIATRFNQKYDNPIYSIDFGMGEDGPLIFELNDQIGFPTWEMKARETFLQAHIKNFAMKLKDLS